MNLKRLRLGIVAGFASFGVDAIVSTFVFPLLLLHLGKTEAGIWMLFSSVGAMLSILSNGLSPAVTRAVAQTAGKASAPGFKEREWGALRNSVNFVYGSASVIALVVGAVMLVVYFRSVAESNHLPFIAVGAGWCGYLVGWLTRIWVARNFNVLNGFGHVGLNRIVSTVAGVANLGLLLLLLPRGWGVLAPVAAYGVIGIALFCASIWLLRQKVPDVWMRQKGERDPAEARKLAADSGRMLVLGLTAYVVSQSCVIFVERSFGAATVATFAPVARVTQLLGAAATIPNGMIMPYLAAAWGAGDMKRYRRLSVAVICVAPVLYTLPALVLFIFPSEIFGRWLGAANFVGSPVARVLIVYGFVSALQNSAALPLLAARHRSFVRESVINLLLVITLLPLLGATFGLVGYPLAMIVGTLIPSGMVLWQSWTFWKRDLNRSEFPAFSRGIQF